MEHFILYDSIKDLTIQELISKLNENPKIVIEEIKLVDLIYDNQSLVGVYVIYNPENKAVYVGKTGSRAILERIAGHFDLRPNAYMNTFLCALASKRKGRKLPVAGVDELKVAFEEARKHQLVIIAINEPDKINRLESVLCRALESIFNSSRGKSFYELHTLVKDL